MKVNRTRAGFTLVEAFTVVGLLMFCCLLFSGRETRYGYCEKCGRKITKSSFTFLLQPVSWRTIEKPTEFNRLYTEFVSPNCTHKWRRYSRGWMGALSSGVACDTRDRWVISATKKMRLLRRLQDKNKIKTILVNCNVPSSRWPGENPANPVGQRAFLAFDELQNVTTTQKENDWWRRNRHVFVKK